MPELPDITVYVEALERRIVGQPLTAVELHTPFLLRSVDPPLAAVAGQTVRTVQRLGKRIVIGLDDDLHLVVHLMIAGRLHWYEARARVPRTRNVLASFQFPDGTLTLTEAGTQ